MIRSMQSLSPIWRNRCRPLGRMVSKEINTYQRHIVHRKEKGVAEGAWESVWVLEHWVQNSSHRLPRCQRDKKKTGKVFWSFSSVKLYLNSNISVSATTSQSSTAWTARWSRRRRRWSERRSPTWWSWCPPRTRTKSRTARRWLLEASLTMWAVSSYLSFCQNRIQMYWEVKNGRHLYFHWENVLDPTLHVFMHSVSDARRSWRWRGSWRVWVSGHQEVVE